MQKKILEHKPTGTLILFLVLFTLAGTFIVRGVEQVVLGLNPAAEQSLLFSRIGMILQDIFFFFLPAYTIYKWSEDKPMQALGMKKERNLIKYSLLGLLVFLIAYPLISASTMWNQQMVLPQWLSAVEDWMRKSEDAIGESMNQFFAEKTIYNLVWNIMIVGVAAGFVEEVFFRGALQQLLEKWTKNGHLAVWIAAFIFSAVHLQFYGFLPRFIMGLILGYLFFYSRNLWVSIFVHFANNTLGVLSQFFSGNTEVVESAAEEAPEMWIPTVFAIISAVLVFFAMRKYAKMMKKKLEVGCLKPEVDS